MFVRGVKCLRKRRKKKLAKNERKQSIKYIKQEFFGDRLFMDTIAMLYGLTLSPVRNASRTRQDLVSLFSATIWLGGSVRSQNAENFALGPTRRLPSTD